MKLIIVLICGIWIGGVVTWFLKPTEVEVVKSPPEVREVYNLTDMDMLRAWASATGYAIVKESELEEFKFMKAQRRADIFEQGRQEGIKQGRQEIIWSQY